LHIKNEYELAHILGTAFSKYGNYLELGNIGIFSGFMNGEEEVTVSLSLAKGVLVVSKGPDVDGYTAEIKLLEGQVKDLQKEVKSLNLLLEEQKPPEKEEESGYTVDKDAEDFFIEPKKETKKRRKKKTI